MRRGERRRRVTTSRSGRSTHLYSGGLSLQRQAEDHDGKQKKRVTGAVRSYAPDSRRGRKGKSGGPPKLLKGGVRRRRLPTSKPTSLWGCGGRQSGEHFRRGRRACDKKRRNVEKARIRPANHRYPARRRSSCAPPQKKESTKKKRRAGASAPRETTGLSALGIAATKRFFTREEKDGGKGQRCAAPSTHANPAYGNGRCQKKETNLLTHLTQRGCRAGGGSWTQD